MEQLKINNAVIKLITQYMKHKKQATFLDVEEYIAHCGYCIERFDLMMLCIESCSLDNNAWAI